ncbi:MAG: lipoyl(octanoyl) transferase LipB [Anaerolineae bacterium]|nr:lipoyl(octanoyl) transferase LipB [Anaerolineae bacterium]
MICKVYRLGVVDYEEAWKLQNELAKKIAAGEQPASLLLLEHPHTYTFGRQGKVENLLWDEAELARREIGVHWVDRGGDVTYHGPGQLVGYPLLKLAANGLQTMTDSGDGRVPQADFIGYLRNLEKVLIRSLFKFGMGAGQVTGQTGVWLQGDVPSRCTKCPPDLFKSPAKIASIGVKVDAQGITRHGFALNVDPDMTYWGGIIACDLANQNKASMAYMLDPVPEMDAVASVVSETFGQVFGFEMEEG